MSSQKTTSMKCSSLLQVRSPCSEKVALMKYGKEVKKSIETNFPDGVVWYKDEVVAEWSEGDEAMILKGSLIPLADEFKALLEGFCPVLALVSSMRPFTSL